MAIKAPPVHPDDQLALTIELRGFLGTDFATVAGREGARDKMLDAATKQIDQWIEGIVVRERKK